MKLIEILLLIAIVLILGVLVLGTDGTTSSRMDNVKNIIRAEGVSHIQMTGYKPFVCGREDLFHDGFEGIRNGIPVKGVACGGILKATTIRYF